MNNRYGHYVLILVLVLGVALCTSAAVSPALAKKSGSGLNQISSETTDYPDDNPGAVEVHTTTAKKDILGDYHIKGEIKNIGEEAISYVRVTGHLYDSNNQTVGVTSCCYTDPTDIEPGHSATFDSFAEKDEISGKPESYRLSYDWD